MWIEDLGEFYEKNVITEGWGGLSMDFKKTNPKVKAPNLAAPSLSYRNNKLGTKEPSMGNHSVAGNVQFGNPYEQEEGVSGDMPKQEILNLISELEQGLDGSDNADRVALMTLNKLKERIT